MRHQLRCGECGRFATKEVLEERDGYCEDCLNESIDELMAEEAELDPHGPCGDGSRCR